MCVCVCVPLTASLAAGGRLSCAVHRTRGMVRRERWPLSAAQQGGGGEGEGGRGREREGGRST